MAKLKQPVKKAEKNVLQLYLQKGRLEAGCDEAGRGCLAGPVVAAAVILPPDFKNDLLTDSKELTEKERDLLRPLIETQALAYAIGVVSHTEIDQINILNASFLAMHRAIAQLSLVPEHLLIDGNRFNLYPNIPHTCIIKGDGKYLPIAAASVLAKTFRDDLMKDLHGHFPQYCWNSNKGYPTRAHRQAIRETGPSPFHRMTFHLLEEQLELDFE
ncbi:MAG: ribonuclease HII [Mangrovibacterium sp.]